MDPARWLRVTQSKNSSLRFSRSRSCSRPQPHSSQSQGEMCDVRQCANSTKIDRSRFSTATPAACCCCCALPRPESSEEKKTSSKKSVHHHYVRRTHTARRLAIGTPVAVYPDDEKYSHDDGQLCARALLGVELVRAASFRNSKLSGHPTAGVEMNSESSSRDLGCIYRGPRPGGNATLA